MPRTGTCLALTAAFGLAACSESKPSTWVALDSGVSVEVDAGRCSALLGGPRDAGAPVSFEHTVLPIFGLSCNFDSCHRGTRGGAFMGLGPKCDVDAASGQCVFPDGAVTADVLDAVFENLLAATMRGAGFARVEPGVPERSFLLLKLSDCQLEAADGGCRDCGTAMPPGLVLSENSPARFETIRQWILAGAPRR